MTGVTPRLRPDGDGEDASAFRALLDASGEAAILLNPAGIILGMNQAAASVLGGTVLGLKGESICRLLPRESGKRVRQTVEEVTRTGQPAHLQEGRGDRLIHSSFYPVIDADCKVTRVAVFERDVTRQRQTETALTQQLNLTQQLLDTIPSPVFWKDKHGRYLGCNRAFSLLFLEEGEDVLGKTIHDLGPPEITAEYQRRDEQLFQEPGVQVYEWTVQGRDGTVRNVIFNKATFTGATGEVAGLVGVITDVTAERRTQEALETAARLEALGVLAGGIAHDFNNQLAAILANLSLAQDKLSLGAPPPLIVTESLSAAEHSVLRARDLTQQLLGFARGGTPLRETTHLSGVVRQGSRLALTGSRHRADVVVAKDLWSCEADPAQITQVVNNLVMNAAQAMETAGVIRVRAENQNVPANSPLPLPAGAYVRVSVSDTGPGIHADQLPRVFDPFHGSRGQRGGLGLATAYAIVKRHDGHLTVASPPGAGPEFTFYLPASPATSLAPEPVASEPPLKGAGRILVMDDEPFLRAALVRMLTSLGYKAESTTNGEEALARYREAMCEGRRFDAVIMDLTIPGGRGGAEVVRDLLVLDPDARAIASSGYSTDSTMAEYQHHGFVGRLPKPYGIQEVGQVLARILRH